MVRARFTGVNHYHDGEQLREGDVVDLTEAQFERWSYQFVRLDEAADDGGADGDDGDGAASAAAGDEAPDDAGEEPADEADAGTDDADAAAGDADDGGDGDGADAAPEPPAPEDLDPHPSDRTVDEVRERVRDVDDPALVRAIRDAEAGDKARSSALDAIDARLTALEE